MSIDNPKYDNHAHAAPSRVDAFSVIAREFYSSVYLTAFAIVRQAEAAEDIAQETFLRAWLHRPSDFFRTPALHPWLIRVARNMAIDWYRKGQQRSRVLPLISIEEANLEPASDSVNPRQASVAVERDHQLNNAVMQLPDDLRQAVLLHYIEGLNASDIARLNGESPSTVTRRLDKARQLLRHHLESGLSASLAMMKPPPHHATRMVAILTAATAVSATTHAQLISLTRDTSAFPGFASPQIAAETAATLKEAGIMKAVLTGSAATKWIVGFAAAGAIIIAGERAIRSMDRSEPSASTIQLREAFVSDSASSGLSDIHVREIPATNSKTVPSPRERIVSLKPLPSERLALLTNELVSTRPQVIIDDSETSGRIELDIEVIDESGLPIESALVKVPQYGFIEKEMHGNIGIAPALQINYRTNSNGIARISVPEKVMDFNTARVTVEVSHPNYTSTRSDMAFTSITRQVLRAGDLVKITAIDAVTSLPLLQNVTPVFHAYFQPEWYQQPDGVVSVRKIGSDVTGFYLKYLDPAGRLYLSEVQPLPKPELRGMSTQVAVYPTISINGKLSDNVPRPVNDIVVETRTFSPDGNTLTRNNDGKTTLTVNPDGTFIISGIPKGSPVHILARGHGFASRLVERPETYGNARVPTFVAESDGQEYILEMAQTATARIRLIDEDGNSVAGATVSVGLNICYNNNCENWDPQIKASTDKNGVALLTDIPSIRDAQFNVSGDWQLPEGKFQSRNHRVELVPAQTCEATLTVFPKAPSNRKMYPMPEGSEAVFTFPN